MAEEGQKGAPSTTERIGGKLERVIYVHLYSAILPWLFRQVRGYAADPPVRRAIEAGIDRTLSDFRAVPSVKERSARPNLRDTSLRALLGLGWGRVLLGVLRCRRLIQGLGRLFGGSSQLRRRSKDVARRLAQEDVCCVVTEHTHVPLQEPVSVHGNRECLSLNSDTWLSS